MSLVVALTLAVGAVVAALAAVWFNGLRARKSLANLPTYPELKYFTSYFKFTVNEEIIVKALEEFSVVSDKMQLPFLVWAGTIPLIFFHEMEEVKTITNTFVGKPYYYSFMREWLGDGLFTAPAPLWKRSIKILGSTFSTTIVESYQEVFNTQSQILVDKMKSEIGGPPFDVMRKYLTYTMLETVVQTALGVPHISESIVSTEYQEAFSRNLCLFQERMFNLPYRLDLVYRLTPSYRELKKNIAIMHQISDVVVSKRVKEYEEKKKNAESQKDSREPPALRYSYLDILLEMRDKHDFLTLEQIKSEVDTITLGGQETVATTLSFLLMVVGQKTDIQDKMVAEIREVFGDSKRPVQKEDLAKLKYCEAVLFETLRLYPAVAVVVRYADKELKLKSCTVPKGAHCAINIWGAGRSRPAWGPDVLEFRPERWLGVDPNSTNLSFMAFSIGRRACIGKKYALNFAKTLIVYILRELRFTSDVDLTRLKIEMSILRAVDGQLVSAYKR